MWSFSQTLLFIFVENPPDTKQHTQIVYTDKHQGPLSLITPFKEKRLSWIPRLVGWELNQHVAAALLYDFKTQSLPLTHRPHRLETHSHNTQADICKPKCTFLTLRPNNQSNESFMCDKPGAAPHFYAATPD